MKTRQDEFKCPSPETCAADQACVYGCTKNSVQARYLRQKEVAAQLLFEGPTAQHKAECDCVEQYGAICNWPKCAGGVRLLEADLAARIAAELAMQNTLHTVKACIWGFAIGASVAILVCWLFLIP